MPADPPHQSTIGAPLNPPRPTPIPPDEVARLGLGWRLSDEARKQIEEIERYVIWWR